jgi:hypothetical protein
MCKGSGANAITNVSQPPAQVMAAYTSLLGRANQVANTLSVIRNGFAGHA